MLLRRQLGNRSRFFDRVSLILSAILVFFIYNHSKSSSSCSILLEKEQSRFANRTRKNLNVSRISLEYKSLFNPLRESAPSVNDVMMAYAHGYSGLPDTTNKLPIKKILFWNEAYGSKDYGNNQRLLQIFFYEDVFILSRYRIRSGRFSEVELSNL